MKVLWLRHQRWALTRPGGLARWWFVALTVLLLAHLAPAAQIDFTKSIKPLLTEFCYDCHGDGADKGGVKLDAFESNPSMFEDHDLWWRVYRMLQADLMPPHKKPQPKAVDKERIEDWIKASVFKFDPAHPDPGRVTVRRLNRVEYRNTIKDLLGVDFNTEAEFPADDSGHGFDNIGDVLTLSPMLLEKYLTAAHAIVEEAVPKVSGVPAELVLVGNQFHEGDKEEESKPGPRSLSYYEPVTVKHVCQILRPGPFQLLVDLSATERFVDNQFDYNKCRLLFKVDGEELLRQEFVREGMKPFHFEFARDWQAGEHELRFEIEPITPGSEQVRSLAVKLNSVTVRGPVVAGALVRPKNYDRFFPKPVPEEAATRREYASKLLGDFATRAFRRPVDADTVDRLVTLAEGTGKSFEAGVAQAMVAVLASPRFLFREELNEPLEPNEPYPLVDEFSLASRLSYFLWSSRPDEELFRLAKEHRLRENLSAQIRRMMSDRRSQSLIENFAGQWLQARDIEGVPIDARAVLARDMKPDPERERRFERFRELRKRVDTLNEEEKAELNELRAQLFRGFNRNRIELTGELRKAMRRETEMLFENVVRQDRSVLELLDAHYTFLNGPLAQFYGMEGITGEEMRRIDLPEDSPRGGILTHGTVLVVTANPTRTSPVKRGLFILENILGTPPAPPPPNLPTLEDVAKEFRDRNPTLRETLALHRSKPLCSSCHDRMDPLGLALENFNAMGRWREEERGQKIEIQGQLITGEEFTSIQQLKKILVTTRRQDFYRCLTEKLLTYALGRGLEYYDVGTVDAIVRRLNEADGRPSALIDGIIDSAPFQRTRAVSTEQTSAAGETSSRAVSSSEVYENEQR